MGKLIDAEKLKNWLWHRPKYNDSWNDRTDIRDHIDQMPTVDAEPVKHGKWIDIDPQTYTWKVRCDQCGHERSMMSTQGKYPKYCEECGAKMDAQEAEE